MEEAYGADHPITKFFPVMRTSWEKDQPYVIPGLGEPGVKRGVPKVMPLGVRQRNVEKHEENGQGQS